MAMSPNGSYPRPGICRLVLVRHAHTELAGTFCGQIDPPLSAQGLAQLPRLKEELAGYAFTHIFSSDLQRARQTAASVAAASGLPVQIEASLRELAFGRWEGLDWDHAMARDPEFAQHWLDHYPLVPAPEGEDFSDFRTRICHAMNAIAAEVQEGCVAVVTHAGVIRTFLSTIAPALGDTAAFLQCDYASYREAWHDGEQWRLPSEITNACDEIRQMSDSRHRS
jgi:alpha-ribazole phosphatase